MLASDRGDPRCAPVGWNVDTRARGINQSVTGARRAEHLCDDPGRRVDNVGYATEVAQLVAHRDQGRLPCLGGSTGGHIARRPEPLGNLAMLFEERHGARERPAKASIGPPYPMLKLERALALDRILNRCHHFRAVGGIDVGVEPAHARRYRVGKEAMPVELAHLLPVRAHPVDRLCAGGHERSQSALARGQRGLGSASLLDVEQDAGEAQRCAILRPVDPAVGLDPVVPPVARRTRYWWA